MADSEVEKTEEIQEQGLSEIKPTGPVPVLMKTRHGTYVERLRDEKGRIVKNPKRIPDAREVTSFMRTFLNSRVANADGKITSGSKKRVEKMFNRIWEIATDPNPDPKSKMAAVKAFEAITLRAYGRPSISDEDKDALQRSGVRIVVINAPEGLPLTEERPKEPRKPDFLEGEVVYTNPPKDSNA